MTSGRKVRNAKSPEMWAMANALLEIAPDEKYLSLPEEDHKSAYIALSNQIGKSKNQKNAVNIHPDFVSFQVPDWTLKASVEAAGLEWEENEEYNKRLHVKVVEPQQIYSHKELFINLLATAKKTSTDRQTTRAVKGSH